MASNKYNRSRSIGSDKRSILQYFSIKQFRFNTSRHPINQSKERCAASLKAVISHQERQIIDGLVNTLECTERQALRICIHEFLNNAEETSAQDLSRARSGSTEKGHEKRNQKLKLQLPSSEKKAFTESRESQGLKEGELLRLTFIWLRNQIRVEDLARLDSSSRRSQIELFRKWSTTHDGSESKLKNLREASDAAWSDAEDRAFNRYLEKEQQKKLRRLYKAEHPYADSAQLDVLIQLDMEKHDPIELEVQRMIEEDGIDEREAEIQRLMLHLCLSRQDAESAVDSCARDQEDQMSDEEIETMLELMWEELHQIRISHWLDDHYQGDWVSLRDDELQAARDQAETEMEAAIAVEQKRFNEAVRQKFSRGRGGLKIPEEAKENHGIGTYFNPSYQNPCKR